VPRIGANHAHNTMSLDDFAVLAALLDRRLDFHDGQLLFSGKETRCLLFS
jgi:hypothetical protein